MDRKYFTYGKRETKYLKRKDPTLGGAMDRIGHVYREVELERHGHSSRAPHALSAPEDYKYCAPPKK